MRYVRNIEMVEVKVDNSILKNPMASNGVSFSILLIKFFSNIFSYFEAVNKCDLNNIILLKWIFFTFIIDMFVLIIFLVCQLINYLLFYHLRVSATDLNSPKQPSITKQTYPNVRNADTNLGTRPRIDM